MTDPHAPVRAVRVPGMRGGHGRQQVRVAGHGGDVPPGQQDEYQQARQRQRRHGQDAPGGSAYRAGRAGFQDAGSI
jgi:hypothetical protein